MVVSVRKYESHAQTEALPSVDAVFYDLHVGFAHMCCVLGESRNKAKPNHENRQIHVENHIFRALSRIFFKMYSQSTLTASHAKNLCKIIVAPI
jgi:hypothetical protein